MRGIIPLMVVCAISFSCGRKSVSFGEDAAGVLRDQVISEARWAMGEAPQTVTSFPCERSEGSLHDFYSEGDYWWPDPEDPDGPYIRRDGMTNPDNFTAHRLAMIRFSRIVGSLTSAWLITGEKEFANHALMHVRAWFIDEDTRMTPSLEFAQAIKGITSGRGIGIIDTIHLIEVARSVIRMDEAGMISGQDMAGIRRWFSDYTYWLRNSKKGIDEMSTTNNHACCWVMQVASFARLTGDVETLRFCSERYKEVLLADQMAADGSFPREINRTKPYGYSLFNLDAMATICQVISTPEDNLWEYTTTDGRNIDSGLGFMFPYIKDKSSWTYGEDVMYWDDWPVAHPALLFGAIAYDNRDYYDLWKSLPHEIAPGEVERNVPVRNPLIWVYYPSPNK